MSVFRTRGVRKPTSKFVAACPCPDGLARDGTQGGELRFVLSCAQGGCACSRDYKRSRGRERECASLFVGPSSRATTLPYEGPGPSFYRCKERVQVYNRECSNVLTCLAERSQSLMYMPTWLLERCWPCLCDAVAVGGALEPCRSTAVGAVGSLLTSPCFHKGLRTVVVMEHAGCHHYLFTGVSQMGRRSCSP